MSHGRRVCFSFFAIVGAVMTSACGGLLAKDDGDAGSQSPVSPAPSVEDCRAACAARYPNGAREYAAVDSCMMRACAAPCTTEISNYDAGTVQAEIFADAGAHVCGTNAITGKSSCDSCAEAHCCAEFVACYVTVSRECPSYQSCVARCPKGP